MKKKQIPDVESKQIVESMNSESSKANKKYENHGNELCLEFNNLQEKLESVRLETQQGINETQNETGFLSKYIRTSLL